MAVVPAGRASRIGARKRHPTVDPIDDSSEFAERPACVRHPYCQPEFP